MIINNKIYFQPSTGLYYAKKLLSSISNKPIVGSALMYEAYSRKNPNINKTIFFSPYELDIAKKSFNKVLYDVTFLRQINVVDNIPKGVIFYMPLPPSLKNLKSGLDVFLASTVQIGDEVVVNNAIISSFANRNKEVGFVDGRLLLEKKDSELDKVLYVNELDSFFSDVLESSLMISSDQRNFLENKKVRFD